jgi:hypothetical protein
MSSLQLSILSSTEIAQVSGGYMDWETDWCGTRVPGWPRPKGLVTLTDRLSLVALNPQPLPPGGGDIGFAVSF